MKSIVFEARHVVDLWEASELEDETIRLVMSSHDCGS